MQYTVEDRIEDKEEDLGEGRVRVQCREEDRVGDIVQARIDNNEFQHISKVRKVRMDDRAVYRIEDMTEDKAEVRREAE